jgi:enoyl-CoA hydratase
MSYETILVEQRDRVTLVTLNRPQALNALNGQVLADLLAAMAAFDADPSQGCAVISGCELAMMCDFILAADTAKFGQPEIKLGVTPGMGGSQRLTHAVGKAKAMEMCLTGRMIDAEEAERAGLVARIVPADQLVEEALKTAATIAGMAPLAILANKEMVNAAFEMGLAQGVQYERRLFHGLFGTADQKEGMAAFVEKRPGNWTGK